YLGGTGSEVAYGLAVDAGGDAFVTGTTTSSNFPSTSGAFQTTISLDNNDGFVTKLAPAGNALVWSSFIGGLGTDAPQGIAVDGTGAAYVTGYTSSTNFDTQSAYQGSNAGSDDVFVTKFKPDGSGLTWSTYVGGTGTEHGQAITVDAGGRAIITGYTTSSDYDTTVGAFDTSLGA